MSPRFLRWSLLVAGCLWIALLPRLAAPASASPELQGAMPAPSFGDPDAPPEPFELPSRAPDMDAGRALFAQRCASCHGPNGAGDGEMSGDLPAPPPNLSEMGTVHGRTMAEAYDIITNGRIEQLMPPWRDALDVDQRWDALAGAWSWHLTPTRLARGRAEWERSCTACHGDDGNALPEAQLGDLATMAERSTTALAEATRDEAEAHDGLGSALGDDSLLLSLDYLRVLPFRHDAADRIEMDGVVAGRVVVGGEGEVDLESVVVEARPIAGDVPGEIQEIDVDAQGRFRAAGMPAGDEVLWLLSASLEGVSYPLDRPITATREVAADLDGGGSDAAGSLEEAAPGAEDQGESASAASAEGGVELVVYAPDPEAPIGLFSLRAFISPLPELGVVEVLERWVIINTSGRARVVGDEPDAFTLRLPLPVGARDVRFADQRMRSTVRSEGDVLVDRLPVPPGEREVLLSYRIPYAGDSISIERELEERLGEMTLVVGDPNATIESEQLPDRQAMDSDGEPLELVAGRMLEEGLVVAAAISGLPPAVLSPQMALAPLPPPPVAGSTLAMLALALAGVATVLALAHPWLAGFVGTRQGPVRDGRSRARDRVLGQLAKLERANKEGELAPKEYARRRASLMERALALAPDPTQARRGGDGDRAPDHHGARR